MVYIINTNKIYYLNNYFISERKAKKCTSHGIPITRSLSRSSDTTTTTQIIPTAVCTIISPLLIQLLWWVPGNRTISTARYLL